MVIRVYMYVERLELASHLLGALADETWAHRRRLLCGCGDLDWSARPEVDPPNGGGRGLCHSRGWGLHRGSGRGLHHSRGRGLCRSRGWGLHRDRGWGLRQSGVWGLHRCRGCGLYIIICIFVYTYMCIYTYIYIYIYIHILFKTKNNRPSPQDDPTEKPLITFGVLNQVVCFGASSVVCIKL